MLRRRGFGGSILMLSQDQAAPVDRPNLSKDYLAGSAPEDWLPLRRDAFYTENEIELYLDAQVIGVDVKACEIIKVGGDRLAYDQLLLATGAEPVRLPIPGASQIQIHTLRSVADCRAIIKTAENARCALVIGASFIGLEVAAALRTRGIEFM
jgi:apoptosis-inducing factor 3